MGHDTYFYLFSRLHGTMCGSALEYVAGVLVLAAVVAGGVVSLQSVAR